MIVYRAMDRQTLDAAYNNSAAVADSERYLADWLGRSGALRARMPDHLNLAYGDAPRARLDFFAANRSGAPALLFFHGGYWQRNIPLLPEASARNGRAAMYQFEYLRGTA